MNPLSSFLQQRHATPLVLQLQHWFPKPDRRSAAIGARTQAEAPLPQMSVVDQHWLKRFEAYLQKHHASPHLSVPDLADAFAMSESSLLRKVKRLTQLTPAQYLRQIRLHKARHLLESGICPSIKQVATAVGYQQTGSFSRSFKEQYGQLPSHFQLR